MYKFEKEKIVSFLSLSRKSKYSSINSNSNNNNLEWKTFPSKVKGMLLTFLLFCCVITTIHGFRLEEALDIAGCLTLCRNVS